VREASFTRGFTALVSCAALIGLAAVSISSVRAQSPLTTLENPGGGQIVYGMVDGQSTEAGAIGTILRSLHGRYGDKPQVGRPFRVTSSNSAAVFFTLTKRNQGGANVAGLVIASRTGPGRVEAALLSDDAARFGSTVNPMLRKLFGVWHPGAGPAPASNGQASSGAPAQPLSSYVLPDRSASVSLPAGWQVEPTSGGGTILAHGPRGEEVALDYPLLAMNSRDPRVQRTMQFAQGAGRNTVYARTLYYPYGNDPGTAFKDLLNMAQRRNGAPEATLQVARETPVPGNAGSRCTRLEGKSDPRDGKGLREFDTIFCTGPLSPMGQYMSILFHTAIPVASAPEQRATLAAILRSFQVNGAVVSREAAAIAAPAIEQIHAIGRAAAAQADAAHARNDAYNQAVQNRWDSQDKHNQAFSNYLLDQTVISDNGNNAHATVWNQMADALVKSDPSRFSYVDTPNFWKGVDY
jgi:hypothetical protein